MKTQKELERQFNHYNLFLSRNKNGELVAITLPVKNGISVFGEPTLEAKQILYETCGNNSWINITSIIDDPRYGWGEKIADDFKI